MQTLDSSNVLALLLAALLGGAGCGAPRENGPPSDGTGGTQGTGGARVGTGGSPGSGGSPSGGSGGGPSATGGATGSGGATSSGGAGGTAAAGGAPGDAGGTGGVTAGDASDSGGPADGPPATPRPDAMGAACAIGQRYAFTIRPFTSQKGTFTAFFTVTPSTAPTNSVIGLSDGQKYLHDDFAAIVRFGTNGMIDARNGTAYTALTPIRYKVTDYHFRLVVDVAAQKYAAYVTYDGMPEITIGTDLVFRDSAGMVTQLNYWGVEAIAPHMTKVCGFLVP